mmetsp:Transcript_4610/g.6896  ORF Transcript_4610/g.6896 Transcript_4610/m.6896 type:complete len:337 (+) Transcript_4610:1038-2048(+)
MKPQDVLAHHVQVTRPKLGESASILLRREAQGRDVVGEGVQPDVHHVVVIPGDLHPPGEGGAADAQVLQPTLDKAEHLISAAGRGNEVRVCLVELQQLVLPLGQLEEIRGLLHHPLHLSPAGGLPVHELGLGVVGLVAHGVPPLVRPQVDVAALVQALPDLLHCRFVVRVRGSDELIFREVHDSQEITKRLGHTVSKLLRAHFFFCCRLLNLFTMLISSSQEVNFMAIKSHEPSDHITSQGGIRMSNMGLIIDVVNWCGDVVGCLFCSFIYCRHCCAKTSTISTKYMTNTQMTSSFRAIKGLNESCRRAQIQSQNHYDQKSARGERQQNWQRHLQL